MSRVRESDMERSSDLGGGLRGDLSSELAGEFDALVVADADQPVFLSPNRRLARSDLASLAKQLGRRLDDSKIARNPGQLVAIAAVNGPGFLAAVLAVWRRAGVALLIDGDVPAPRRRLTAAKLGATHCLSCGEAWPESHASIAVEEVGEVRTATGEPTMLPGAAVVKLTSGSTGEPRGILISPGAVRADTDAIERAMGIGADDRLVTAIPMSFSYGFGSLAVPALLAGRQLVLPEPGQPLAAMTAARQCEATVLHTVPAFLSALIKRDPDWRLPPTLRLVVSAGAPLPPEVAKEFRQRFGTPIHVFYGASECGGISYDPTGDAGELGLVGRPVPGVIIELAGEESLVEVRSPAVATGYLPPQPEVLGSGCYRTNDRAAWEGRDLKLVGRRGSVINLGGHKVNPREIEQVIARLPGVDTVFVTEVSSSEGRPTSCCAIVETTDPHVTRRSVHDWCLEQLPSFKLPRRILVVAELPRNARGKVSAEVVRRMAAGTE